MTILYWSILLSQFLLQTISPKYAYCYRKPEKKLQPPSNCISIFTFQKDDFILMASSTVDRWSCCYKPYAVLWVASQALKLKGQPKDFQPKIPQIMLNSNSNFLHVFTIFSQHKDIINLYSHFFLYSTRIL